MNEQQTVKLAFENVRKDIEWLIGVIRSYRCGYERLSTHQLRWLSVYEDELTALKKKEVELIKNLSEVGIGGSESGASDE